jgi:hypothetical protein
MFISRLAILAALCQEFAVGGKVVLSSNRYLRKSKKSKGLFVYHSDTTTISTTIGTGSVIGTLVGLDHCADVTVTLCGTSGTKCVATKADVSGTFEFTSLLEDTYSIHVEIPSQYSSIVTSTAFDSQVTVLSNQVATISLGSDNIIP